MPIADFLSIVLSVGQVHLTTNERRNIVVAQQTVVKAQRDVEERPAAGDLRERLLKGMPVIDQRLHVGGVSTAVLQGGTGAPIVLLHSSGEFAALWMRVIPDLVKTHRVIAPDLPGHGASEVVDGSLDADHVVAWLGELIERTCPSPPTLVGHGLGGAIAARFAIKQSNRIRHLVLVDAFGLGSFEPAPSFGLALNHFLEQPTAHTRDSLFAQCFADLNGLREQIGEHWTSIAAYALDRVRTPGMKASLGSLMPQVGMPAIPPTELQRITVPTTLIWGRQDLQVPLRIAEAASACYGWPLHVIENAGDDPPLEQPTAFLSALRPLLESSAKEETPR